MAWTLLLAAGQGNRLASATGGLAKQFLDWKGAPLYWESALVFSRCARVDGLVFVFPEACIDEERERVAGLMRNASLGIPWKVVAGGALRQDSVRNGLAALPGDCMEILIHDAARPFVSPVLVNRILDGLHGEASGECVAACIPGIPVVDTIKVMDEEKKVVATPDRKHLMAVQTPQGFSLAFLRAAHQRAEEEGWVVTDDASLLELCGHAVHVAEGEAGNKKITTPEDLEMLRMTGERIPCVGYGYDVHKYADGNEARQSARPMRLGGVPIAGSPDVLAHSDGDVLLHALIDALLGCIGAGDIGTFFPDSDPAFDNVNSAVLLDTVLEHVLKANVHITHVDLTVIAQIPKVGPHREMIRRNVARLLGLDLRAVNVKATTEEGLGFTGERLGIKAVAVVTGLRGNRDA